MGRGRRRGRSTRSPEARFEAPPLFRRGRWWAADFRTWRPGRITLRDPEAPTWPAGGDRTADKEVALRWVINGYLPLFREEDRRRQLKLGPKPKRLGDAADAWLQVRRRSGKAEATRQINRTALNHLRERLGKDFRTDRLTTPVLQAFFDEFVEAGYSENSLRVMRESVSGFQRWLYGLPKRAPTPATGVELPEVVLEEVATWTDEQRETLQGAADELDQEEGDFRAHRLLVELGLAGGLRRNEEFAALWPQIRERSRTIRITHQVAKGSRILLRLKGKTARTALLLPSWWPFHREGATGFILGDVHGTLVPPSRFVPIRRRLLERANLYRPGLGYHIDRHTYARDFIEQGGRFEELRKSLGHTSIVTTEKLYGHFHEDVAAELARQRIYREEPIRLLR